MPPLGTVCARARACAHRVSPRGPCVHRPLLRPQTEIVAASRPDPATVDAPPGAALVTPTGPSAERRSSGTPFPPVAAATAPGRPALGGSLRRILSRSCHQVAHHPLDSPFLRAYCIYLLCCVSLNALLKLL